MKLVYELFSLRRGDDAPALHSADAPNAVEPISAPLGVTTLATSYKATKAPCDDDACIICLENEIDTTLQPCGHKRLCLMCATQVQKCPMCRSNYYEALSKRRRILAEATQRPRRHRAARAAAVLVRRSGVPRGGVQAHAQRTRRRALCCAGRGDAGWLGGARQGGARRSVRPARRRTD